ncbi:GEVED domain-containing protein [uncultured Psychroserpens sp.]|uniref:zinc-dependent metalloprotease n=1 Tax=uncultured Psychroserpens sp. TaxID=255436 RepID=UPI0026069BAA|nr:GEVED domain-containing protein [uncultured Psychroserpens sp.]
MKKNFTLKSIFAILMLLCTISSYAQERTCGMVEYMEEQMKDPKFVKEYEKNQAIFKARLAEVMAQGEFSQRGASVVIPVAVHFPNGNEADRACLEALAQNQIDILNADYAGTNADISNWTAASAFYPGISTGNANISFCIAVSNHPIGLDPELLEGNPAVTIGYNFGGGNNADTNWAGYMNFVVRPIGGGTLGFSPYPGSIAAGQAVTMNTFAFGSGAGCPGSGVVPDTTFGLGRTVTHELGHFYNLDHTWGGAGGCANDDGIADTPNITGPTYGCPANGSEAGCTATPSLTMNYMDYVDDACMYMFSAGQTTTVSTYVNSVLLSQLKPGVCTPAAPGFSIVGANSPISDCSGEDVVFMMNYSTVQDFSETATFSVSGNPAGSNVVFNPTSMSTDGVFTMTVENLGGAALGDYTMTVTGTSATQTKTADVTLSIIDDLCPSSGNTTYNTSNEGVVFGTISNLNTGKNTGYDDYTATYATDVNKEESYDLTVNVNTDGNFPVETRVWIDWNQNCSFDDPGEEYDLGFTANVANGPSGGSPLSITIPNTAATGSTTMRVATKYVNTDDPGLPESCLTNYDGETEDYTLNVMASLSVGENEFENFAIFPNPNKGEFTIKLSSYSGNDISVDIFDIRGRRIFDNTYSSNSNFNQVVKLNDVHSGVYLVSISDGDKKTTKKIIVE